jgi:hypothetical protein
MAANVSTSNYRAQDKSDTKHRRQVRYTGPASYVTGGDPFTPADVGLSQIHVVGGSGSLRAWNGTNTRVVVWDATNQKMIWIVPTTDAEVANATDLSAYTVDAEFIGL